jgi:hypothetical protein
LPAIVFSKRVLERDDSTSDDDESTAFKEVFGGGMDIRNAELNLKAINKAIVSGAKERAVSNELALALKMAWYGLELENKETVIYEAWRQLQRSLFDETDSVELILAKLESRLRAFEKQIQLGNKNRRISAEKIMKFLRKKGERGGRRFIGNNRDGKWPRPRWIVFRNAFVAWFFALKQRSVPSYLRDAAKQALVDPEVYNAWELPKTAVSGILYDLLSIPLVIVRPQPLSPKRMSIFPVSNEPSRWLPRRTMISNRDKRKFFVPI